MVIVAVRQNHGIGGSEIDSEVLRVMHEDFGCRARVEQHPLRPSFDPESKPMFTPEMAPQSSVLDQNSYRNGLGHRTNRLCRGDHGLRHSYGNYFGPGGDDPVCRQGLFQNHFPTRDLDDFTPYLQHRPKGRGLQKIDL